MSEYYTSNDAEAFQKDIVELRNENEALKDEIIKIRGLLFKIYDSGYSMFEHREVKELLGISDE